MSNRKWWYAACALALVVGIAAWAAPGSVSVTGSTIANYAKQTITFTLNGTTPVTATVDAVAPVKGGSILAKLASAPAGTVTLSAYNSDVFTAVGQKDLVSEAFASEALQVGLFEALGAGATPGGYMLAPARITISIVSNSTADTAITGTAVVALVN